MEIVASHVKTPYGCALHYEVGNQRTEIVLSHMPGKPVSLVLACWLVVEPGSPEYEEDLKEPLLYQEFTGAELQQRLAFFQQLRIEGILGNDGLLSVA